MSDEKQLSAVSEERPSKRAYEAPRIEESGGFERLVLGCGHSNGFPNTPANPCSVAAGSHAKS